jgi:hypothetical protein
MAAAEFEAIEARYGNNQEPEADSLRSPAPKMSGSQAGSPQTHIKSSHRGSLRVQIGARGMDVGSEGAEPFSALGIAQNN